MAVTTTQTANTVKYVALAWATYVAIASKDANTIYFITDKGIIFKGGTQMTTGVEMVNNYAALSASMPLDRLYIAADTRKLYYYDSTLQTPAFVEISKTEYLGNGSVDTNNGGAEINRVYGSASATQVVTEQQVSKFVADEIALLSSGVGSIHGEPVADLTALAALDSSELTDKMILLVEANNAIWRWDAEATATPSSGANISVVLPTDLAEDYAEDASTPGRWIKLLNGSSLFLSDATPATIGFDDQDSDNVYAAISATAGVSDSPSRADHVHALSGVARIDQICWQTAAVEAGE